MRLYRSNHLERLFERLLEVCAEPLPDPFAREWIVVRHPGMGRWLERRRAKEKGIAALLYFPLPARALGELEALFSGADEAGKADAAAWEQAVLRWRIFRLLPGHAADPAFTPLAPYLNDDEAARFRLSGRITAVFDQYQTYRPELLRDWEDGKEAGDWQARLWRELCAESEGPPRHRARRDRDFLNRLRAGRTRPDAACPTRLHLFGVNSLPPISLELFAALGRRIETHCYQLSPCRGYWHDLERRQLPPLLQLSGKDNSLLAGLGAVGRDFTCQLRKAGLEDAAEDLYKEPEGDTLLAELQRGILDARPMPGNAEDRIAVAHDDRSIELHCAWSPLGEVQALRDYLLDCFADETLHLTPGDILVAAPDIDRYAGTVRAVFGETRPLVPFALADRPAARESAVPGLFLALLDYLGSRCAVPELLELLEYPALHRRFGMEAADLPSARRLLREAGAAWGLDEAQRGEMGLAAAGAEHSLRHALDRLLLGRAMGDADALHAGLAPCTSDGENAATALTGLLELCRSLKRWRALWLAERETGEWPGFLLAMQAAFLHPDEDAEGQRGLREAIAALAEETALARCAGELGRRVVRLRLEEHLNEGPGVGGGALPGGRVAFCNMVPMRSLPFKVICLLGLNDGDFPRTQRPPAFDRMAAQPRPGDRNRKDDDRYLFLEAILSARDRLYISWVGHDRRDGKERPPSPVIGELRDHLDACFAPADAPKGSIGARLVREHPMQPFSEDNYNGKSGPPGYDEAWLPAVAKIAPPLPETRLPEAADEDDRRRVEPADLLAFWRNPARWFLRRRLGMRLFEDAELPPDSEPFTLGGLEKHGIRAEIIRRRLRGQEPEEIGRLLVARGLLPQSHFAESALAAPLAEAEALAHVLKPLLTGPLPALPIDMSVEAGPDRFRMCGHLDELHAGGRVVWAAGRAHAGFFIDAWLGHLILAAADPGRIPARSNLAALSEHGGQADLWTFAPLAATEALALLAPWLMYYARGQNEALPFFPKSAWAWAQRLRKGEDAARAEAAALAAWQDGYQHEGERTDAAFGRLFPVADPCAVPGFRELAEALLPPLSDHLEKC